jgi:cysteine desulfurase
MGGSRTATYFDCHATTPVAPVVLQTMLPYFSEKFGNPGSAQHTLGWEASTAVETARAQVARLVGGGANEIIFTAGATESISICFHSAFANAKARGNARPHFISTNVEHKATLETLHGLQKQGAEVTLLECSTLGAVTASQVRSALRANTVLVSVIHGNNEIGTLNPLHEIGDCLRNSGQIEFHVDIAQSLGKHEIDVRAMGIAWLSMSAHKLYGPKGVGALYARIHHEPRVHIQPLFIGGGQEQSLRAGTLNVPGIVGFGAACELASQEMSTEAPRLAKLRDRIISEVQLKYPEVKLNGDPVNRLCNNVNLTIPDVDGDQLFLEMREFAFSTASACVGTSESHVLKAIGHDAKNPLQATIRLGLGRFHTDGDVTHLLAALLPAIQNAKVISKSYER